MEPLILVPLMVRAVPQVDVVMFAEPLKLVPLMVREVWRVVAVHAFPDKAPENVPATSVLVLGL